MMYIDCGRTVQANEGWCEVFSPSLIPEVFLLIMQDWSLDCVRRRQSYSRTLRFTAAHPELELVTRSRLGTSLRSSIADLNLADMVGP